jgi:hypothetical protein
VSERPTRFVEAGSSILHPPRERENLSAGFARGLTLSCEILPFLSENAGCTFSVSYDIMTTGNCAMNNRFGST